MLGTTSEKSWFERSPAVRIQADNVVSVSQEVPRLNRALAHCQYFSVALSATTEAVTIGGTLLTDDAFRHERTPYSILVVFTTTTAPEPKLGGDSCNKT